MTNQELIGSIYGAFGRGDVGFIADRVTPESRWDFAVTESNVPWHVPVTGPAELPRFFGALMDNVELTAFEPVHFVAVGADVICHVRIAYTVKRTGRRVEEEQLHWWTIDHGKVARLRHFEDTAQVIAAWGA